MARSLDYLNYLRGVDDVVGALLHSEFPCSFAVVAPPCFAGDELAAVIASETRKRAPDVPIAHISPDEVPDENAYIDALARGWSDRMSLPKREQDQNNELYLRQLARHASAERPLVQVVSRFHTILEKVEDWLLGLMRALEQSHVLRTVVITPYPYAEMKRRWRKVGAKLSASSYGDKHRVWTIALPPRKWVMSKLSDAMVPPHIAEFFVDLSGGYPEIIHHLVACWAHGGRRPELDQEVRSHLRAEAVQQIAPLLRLLDAPGENMFLERAVDHASKGADVDLYHLSEHSWGSLLLREDGEFRASVFRQAAIRFWVERVRGGGGATRIVDLLRRAVGLYRQRRFGLVGELLESCSRNYLPAELQLVDHNARIMSAMCGHDGERFPEDIRWGELALALKEAKRWIDELSPSEIWRVECLRRYRELEELCGEVCRVRRHAGARIVDALGGLIADVSGQRPELALVLICGATRVAMRVDGDASSVRLVLAIPEQIFRIWAFAELSLNYYRAPELTCEVVNAVRQAWPSGRPQFPVVGEAFPSFKLFAYVAVAMARECAVGAPEGDFTSLEKAIARMEVRQDGAHAFMAGDAARRRAYFSLIDRWLVAALKANKLDMSRDELEAYFDPLPVVE